MRVGIGSGRGFLIKPRYIIFFDKLQTMSGNSLLGNLINFLIFTHTDDDYQYVIALADKLVYNAQTSAPQLHSSSFKFNIVRGFIIGRREFKFLIHLLLGDYSGGVEMGHTLCSGSEKPCIVDFIQKPDIFIRGKKDAFRRVVFHHNFRATVFYFIKNFASQPAVEQGNGDRAFYCASDGTHQYHLFDYSI